MCKKREHRFLHSVMIGTIKKAHNQVKVKLDCGLDYISLKG